MNLSAIQGGDGIPPEPDWASIYVDEFDILEAHEQWGIAVRELQDSGTLSVANGGSIKRLVEFRIQYERSSKHVAEHGPVLKGKRAKVGQWNPHWSVMRQAEEHIRQIEARLGIDPISRGKATKVVRGKKAPRAADSYLKPVSK